MAMSAAWDGLARLDASRMAGAQVFSGKHRAGRRGCRLPRSEGLRAELLTFGDWNKGATATIPESPETTAATIG